MQHEAAAARRPTSDRAAAAAFTGGQYGIVRVAAAAPLAALYATRLAGDGSLASAACLVAAASVAVGFRDRWFALLLVPILIAEAARGGGVAGPLGLAAFFALHTTAPPAPFGSIDARGRVDPAGDWAVSPRFVRRTWRLLTLIALLRAAELVAVRSSAATVLALTTALAGLMALRGRPDPGLWLLIATLLVVALPLGATPLDALAVVAGLVATVSPAWLPPDGARAPFILFYDGACGLCHRTVRFLLAEDRAGLFRFAPLGGPTFLDRVPPGERAALPDSMVLRTADGTLLVGATGVLTTGRALGGWWRVGASAAAHLPNALLEAAYALLVRSRRRIFRRPDATCPLTPGSLRGRFPDLAT
jgi:predicted DCC family thiol-disulfide oxidoreductase YuxK